MLLSEAVGEAAGAQLGIDEQATDTSLHDLPRWPTNVNATKPQSLLF